MSSKYDELAHRAERGELAVKPGTTRRGDAAAREEIQRFVMDATGASTVEEAAKIAVGRPRERAESDIVREAVAAYVDMRQVS